MSDTPVRIGVIIAPLGAGGDPLVLKYLLLHQNSLQQSFEFQLLPFFRHSIIQQLSAGQSPNRKEIVAAMPAFLEEYRENLAQFALGYGHPTESNLPIVILSTAKFTDNYYLTGGNGWGIVALGNWRRIMAPPSIVEFFLSLVMELAINFACGAAYPRRHITTRGCCFDFTAELGDARFSVLSGFLCEQCLKTIRTAHSKQVAEDAQVLLRKEWLGTVAEPSSVSVTAKKLGYDLFHTKGVTPTWWERTRAILEEEVVRTILKIIAAVVVVGLLIYFGFKSTG